MAGTEKWFNVKQEQLQDSGMSMFTSKTLLKLFIYISVIFY